MLSICQLHLQLPFDDCPTVAAACSRRRHCVTHSDSGTVVVCVCLCNYCQFTDNYDKGELCLLFSVY